jgi:gluconate:H+ symporter, GntP family
LFLNLEGGFSLDAYLLILTVLAIIIVILGVSLFKWHAFISLTIASLFLALFSGMPWNKIVGSYETGVAGALGHLVGIFALGTILGKMLAESGGGLSIANFFVRMAGEKMLPWAMFCSGFIIGIPVFFEVGVLILLPLVISIHKASKKNILLIALPAIAGLSIVHGIIPPHPGAIAAIGIYGANMGKVLLYGLIVAIPSGIIAGPLFASMIHKRVIPQEDPKFIEVKEKESAVLPGVGVSLFVILLPIILLLFGTFASYLTSNTGVQHVLAFIGSPLVALLISVFVAYYLLGFSKGMNRELIKKLTEESILPIGSIIIIIGAGGGFKQILIDSGVAKVIGNMANNFSLSPLVLAFLIAALIRVATGSATVALTTAAGIVAPIVSHMSGVNLELLVIATGAGSLIASHVNDAGFWMVKEYLGLSLKETFKTWTLLETILSVVAFAITLIINAFV